MDGPETGYAWLEILRRDAPAGLILTRQGLPTLHRGEEGLASTVNVAKGAYILKDTEGTPDVLLMGSGSEVQLAVEAAKELAALFRYLAWNGSNSRTMPTRNRSCLLP